MFTIPVVFFNFNWCLSRVIFFVNVLFGRWWFHFRIFLSRCGFFFFLLIWSMYSRMISGWSFWCQLLVPTIVLCNISIWLIPSISLLWLYLPTVSQLYIIYYFHPLHPSRFLSPFVQKCLHIISFYSLIVYCWVLLLPSSYLFFTNFLFAIFFDPVFPFFLSLTNLVACIIAWRIFPSELVFLDYFHLLISTSWPMFLSNLGVYSCPES